MKTEIFRFFRFFSEFLNIHLKVPIKNLFNRGFKDSFRIFRIFYNFIIHSYYKLYLIRVKTGLRATKIK